MWNISNQGGGKGNKCAGSCGYGRRESSADDEKSTGQEDDEEEGKEEDEEDGEGEDQD